MKSYEPALVVGPEGVEQSFTANVVSTEDDLVAFGDLLPDEQRGLPFGTPVHSLLIHLGDEGPELFELNDQGNTVKRRALLRAELGSDRLRFVFRARAGPFAGRVSLSREIEVFRDKRPSRTGPFAKYRRFDDVRLSVLEIRFAIEPTQLGALRDKLAAVLQ